MASKYGCYAFLQSIPDMQPYNCMKTNFISFRVVLFLLLDYPTLGTGTLDKSTIVALSTDELPQNWLAGAAKGTYCTTAVMGFPEILDFTM